MRLRYNWDHSAPHRPCASLCLTFQGADLLVQLSLVSFPSVVYELAPEPRLSRGAGLRKWSYIRLCESVFLLLRPCRWFLDVWLSRKVKEKKTVSFLHDSQVFWGWIKKGLFNGQHKSWALPQFHELQYFLQLLSKEHLHHFTCILPAKGWISSIKLGQNICSSRVFLFQFKGLSLHVEFHYSRKMHHKNSFYLTQCKPNKL